MTADAHLDAQVDAVIAARALIRSAAPHSVADIRRACATLQTLGDGLDYLDARHMLAALDKRRQPVRRVPIKPAYSPNVVRLRDALIGGLVGVWGVWLLLVLVLAGGRV